MSYQLAEHVYVCSSRHLRSLVVEWAENWSAYYEFIYLFQWPFCRVLQSEVPDGFASVWRNFRETASVLGCLKSLNVGECVKKKLLFVVRPTKRTNVAQGLFLGESGCRAIAQTRLRPRRHPPKKARLRCQVIKLTPPRRVRACGDVLALPKWMPVS